MSNIINARSPYYIRTISDPASNSQTNLVYVEHKIYIWSGDKVNDIPTTPTYTIDKFVKNVDDNFTLIEVSELIRDYLETEYYNIAVDAVWVKVEKLRYDDQGNVLNPSQDEATFLAFDGFGEFNEGINPRTSIDPTSTSGFTPMVLQSNTCIPFVRGRDIKIPIFSEPRPQAVTTVTDEVWNFTDDFWEVVDSNWEATTQTQNVTDNDDSNDKIYYLIITTDNALTGDTITITSTVGNSQSVTLTLNEVCEPKYEAYRSIFYNKFGALQSFWMPTKNVVQTKTKSKDYNATTIEASFTAAPSYSQYKHTKKRFQIDSHQSITLNTALLNECLNAPIEQLLVSEQVWLEDESLEVLPVILRSNNITRKTGVNDKAMIQYTLNFDYAFEFIQNIR